MRLQCHLIRVKSPESGRPFIRRGGVITAIPLVIDTRASEYARAESPPNWCQPVCPPAEAKIGVCCIFETSATAFKRPVGECKVARSKPHDLTPPDSLTFDVFRTARQPFPHREEAFHAGY
jgi:hypothetical protein